MTIQLPPHKHPADVYVLDLSPLINALPMDFAGHVLAYDPTICNPIELFVEFYFRHVENYAVDGPINTVMESRVWNYFQSLDRAMGTMWSMVRYLPYPTGETVIKVRKTTLWVINIAT